MSQIIISKSSFSTSVRLPFIGDIINVDWSKEEIIIDGLDLNEVAVLHRDGNIAIMRVPNRQIPIQHFQNNALPSPNTDSGALVKPIHLPKCVHFTDSEDTWVGRNNVHINQDRNNHKRLVCNNCGTTASNPISKEISSKIQ